MSTGIYGSIRQRTSVASEPRDRSAPSKRRARTRAGESEGRRPSDKIAPMRFLRLLTNSLLAGALGAAYLTILVLQLNPQVPLASTSVWHWYVTLGLFYGLHLALLFYVTMLLREFFSVEIFSPGWISVRLLAWLAAAAAAVASTLMWLNLRGFPALFDEAAARR